MEIKQLIAGRAFIIHTSKILLIRESKAYQGGNHIGKYDTPGGKIHPGETYQEALSREVMEECGLKIELGSPFYVGEWRPVVKESQLQIIAVFSECFVNTPEVTLSSDHDDFQWISPEDYMKFPIIESTIPAFEAYLQFKNNK